MGLDVQDKIRILVEDRNELVKNALEANKDYICTETQALELKFMDSITDGRTIDMDDLKIVLKIEV